MSADNYHAVHRIDDEWHVWLNLSASIDHDEQVTRQPDATFIDRETAVGWAINQGWTEYGVTIHDEPTFPFERDQRGQSDAGLHLATGTDVRVLPCILRTWCILDLDHAGPCHEVPRRAMPPTDFGPNASKGRRW